MDQSYLKDLLWRGREVEFDYGTSRYVITKTDRRLRTEYSFGRKWGGTMITSDYFDGILYRREFGTSLYDMLREIDGSRVTIY